MRLYVIPAGTLRIDKGAVFTPGIDEGVQIEVPVPVYLIQTDDDENVLVDTGLHPANVDNPHHTWGEHAANVVLPILAPTDLLERRLAEIELALGDITHIVNTHLHPDHCGANFLFPHADILVQRDQYDEALAHPEIDNDLFHPPRAHLHAPRRRPATVRRRPCDRRPPDTRAAFKPSSSLSPTAATS